jgi:CAAX prenyl protease-like protein
LTTKPAIPYVLPFAVFLALLVILPELKLLPRTDALLRFLIVAAAILIFSRGALQWRIQRPLPSVLVGFLVFVIWVAPDQIWPNYHYHWLFQNAITGKMTLSTTAEAMSDKTFLWLRSLRAILLVPILEELFWRGWLMRWIIKPDFRKVPLGAYTPMSFWIVAVLFAMEHGVFWDVGLVAGAVYNWWMVRSKSIEDCILAHAVTNACLCLYVVATGRWEYWL